MKIFLDANRPHVVEPEDLSSFAVVIVGSRQAASSDRGVAGLAEAGEFSHDGNTLHSLNRHGSGNR